MNLDSNAISGGVGHSNIFLKNGENLTIEN